MPGQWRGLRGSLSSAAVRDDSVASSRATPGEPIYVPELCAAEPQLEDVQKAAGRRDPSTTKLYDRHGYNPEKAVSFFATY